MSQRKVRPFGSVPGIFEFYCAGCKMEHVFYTVKDVPNRPTWLFNGDLDKPTLSPSLLVEFTWGEERTPCRCHSFIKEGNIQYLNDCTHALAGQTVPLLPIDEIDD